MPVTDLNTQDPFAAIDQELGLSDRLVDMSDTATFTKEDEKSVQDIIKESAPNNIDTSKDKPAEPAATEDDFPEFFKPFKDILDQPYVLPEDDKTDYGQRAVQEFGPNFGHLNTRDAFFEETFQRNAKDEFLNSSERVTTYKALLDIEEGRFDKSELLKVRIQNALKAEAAKTFSEFDDEKYQKILSNFFEDEGKGKPTPAGEAKINQFVTEYTGHLASLRQQAEQHAKSELNAYRTNNAALAAEAERISIAGLQLGPDLGSHVLNFIRSGKLDEWENEDNLSPQELSVRTLKKALIADDKAFMSFLKKVVSSSVHHGVSTVAKKKF